MNDFSKKYTNYFTEQKHCNIPHDVLQAEKNYKSFVQQINKSDFCNTSRRYIAELAYVRRLTELYSENNCAKLQSEMEEREAEILKKLKEEFGIIYNN
ncbi:hypothetical protein IJ425_03605 [bacterium]|nr:hypothetical protein [bacterium]